MPKLHNQLIRLLKNPTNEKIKKFNSKVFLHSDFDKFRKHGLYHIKKAINLNAQKDRLIPLSCRRSAEVVQLKRVERDVHFGIGSEYLIKSIFLYNGYAINKVKKGFSSTLSEPYKIHRNRGKLDPSNVVKFEYLRQNLKDVVDLSVFDNNIKEVNRDIVSKRRSMYRPRGITTTMYTKLNSAEILIYLQCLRNNYAHKPEIIPEFSGTFRDNLMFFSFLTKTVYGSTVKQFCKSIPITAP